MTDLTLENQLAADPAASRQLDEAIDLQTLHIHSDALEIDFCDAIDWRRFCLSADLDSDAAARRGIALCFLETAVARARISR